MGMIMRRRGGWIDGARWPESPERRLERLERLDLLTQVEGLTAERDRYRVELSNSRVNMMKLWSSVVRVVQEHIEPVRPLGRPEVDVLRDALHAALIGDAVPDRAEALVEALARDAALRRDWVGP